MAGRLHRELSNNGHHGSNKQGRSWDYNSALFRFLTTRNQNNVQGLDEALYKWSNCECEDSRDSIFGLMAIVTPKQALVVDYTASIENVLVEACAHAVAFKSLNRERECPQSFHGLSTIAQNRLNVEGSPNLARDIRTCYGWLIAGNDVEAALGIGRYLSPIALRRLSGPGFEISLGEGLMKILF
jgi:hypothetical protein